MLKIGVFYDAGVLIRYQNREDKGATISCIDAPRNAIGNVVL